MPRLFDKTILVTGASGAVGLALCRAVAREGGRAVATDLNAGGPVHDALDVTRERDWIAICERIAREHGHLDGLVNAAGIVLLGSIEDTSLDDFRRVLAVNLEGTFLGCKYAMPLLKKRGGSIVNVSSVSGLVGGHNLAAYNASKGGVRLLTKSIAMHGARSDPKVRCNSVHPAFLEGAMTQSLLDASTDALRARQRMVGAVPLRRLGTAEEVADLCVYLLGDESGFVTGAEFVIDGGLTAT